MQTLPPEKLAPILADARIHSLLEHAHGVGLILRIGKQWHMIGASSISIPGGPKDRPVTGILGFVSSLNRERMDRIRALAGVPFTLDVLDGRPTKLLADGDFVVMRRILHDNDGKEMAALNIRYPQPLAEQIRNGRRLILLSSLAIFAIGGTLIWLLVERGAISRLERLHGELEEVSTGKRAALPVSSRNDEVDHLANGINHLHAELSRLNERWRHEALHDSLTGLGNRARLLEEIEAALASRNENNPGGNRRLCLMLIDLDGFKIVNDLFGHALGDQVLRSVAERMSLALPPCSQCFRLGGDEFAVLAHGLDMPSVRAFAHTLNASVRADHSNGAAQLLLSASIGVTCIPTDGHPVATSELLQRADVALYSIKRKARNGFAIFDDSMLEDLQRNNVFLRHLREALQTGKIDVWFQPIISAQNGSVLSFEALARWHDDALGDIPPLRFVAMAEENFLGAALDKAVLEKAVAGLLELRKLAPHVALSVNASIQSLLDPGYVALVPQVLARAQLSGESLRVEITESVLAANESMLLKQLDILRESGVRMELDDFGTGYSSLGRLVQIHPRGIKLDRSFVRNLDTGGDRICRAIISLAQELGIEIIAEGVERSSDAEFLRDAGCDALQGYLYSKPLPLHSALEWLRRHTNPSAD